MKSIPYGRQNITDDDIKSVTETLKSDFLTQGPKVNEFEKKFSKYVNSKYAIAVSNATAALHLGVISLGLKEGQRVITTPITFASSANCARFVNAEVWFADIDPDTYLICLNSLEKLIKSKPKGFFSGLIIVDFAGLPADLESFKSLADEHNLWLIEDACHAPGAYFLNQNKSIIRSGQGKYSDLSVFSFHPVKHIACGEGGMITTNSEILYKKLIKLRTHGISKDDMTENHGGWYYEMSELGFNYRLTDIQASLGISQLKRNHLGIKIRNKIANNYIKAFKGKIKYQKFNSKFFNAYHLFIIEIKNRKKLYNKLKEKGIFTQVHYIPLHILPYYKSIGYEDADLKNSEKYYSRCLSLPMYPTLKPEEQKLVIKEVLDFEKNNK